MSFKRTFPDVHPLSTEYTAKAGVINPISTLLAPKEPAFYNSFWFMFFVHGSDSHDYFAVGHVVAYTATLPPQPLFRVSLLDINDGTYFGQSYSTPDAPYALDRVSFKSEQFEVYSTSEGDQLSFVCKSTIKGAEFNFALSPRGPALYAGGHGTFSWGSDWTYQMSFPEMWVTGSLTHKGKVVEVVPEKSMAWLDRQYGVGAGRNGWDLYMLLFENGIKASIWHSEAYGGEPKQYFATLVYPDSHHEIYPIDDNLDVSQPFTSEKTGYVYHAHQIITIPGLPARIEIQQPWAVGEMALDENCDADSTLFEGFVTIKAQIRGEDVKGWGVSERRFPDHQLAK